MMSLRPVFALLLCALVSLTGTATAMARGGMAADGIICGDGTYSVVLAADGLPLFDSSGEPVLRVTLPCLDCVFAAFIAPGDAPRPAQLLKSADMLTGDLLPLPRPQFRHPGGQARAPPGLV